MTFDILRNCIIVVTYTLFLVLYDYNILYSTFTTSLRSLSNYVHIPALAYVVMPGRSAICRLGTIKYCNIT